MKSDHPHSADELEDQMASIADEFLQQLERGEEPDIEQYVQRYPQMAETLRQVLTILKAVGGTGDHWCGDNEPDGPLGPGNSALGDFRIVRELGRGGMGVVYEAEQLSLGRRVALKVLPFAAVLDSRRLQRFKIEAQAAAQLHHTNIVPVYSVGCERGVHYYAMQYVDGQPLSAVIRELRRLFGFDETQVGSAEGPLSRVTANLASGHLAESDRLAKTQQFGEMQGIMTSQCALAGMTSSGSVRSLSYIRSAVALGVQAAEALQYAHDMGILHRDIKPSNLLIDAHAHLWITDFGLAHYRAGSKVTLTGAADILGTVHYMSPEQAAGQTSLLDQRTDIYSLGVTLYELLTLTSLYGRIHRQELLRSIEVEEPVNVRRLNPTVPTDLQTIVGKAIEKDPAQRYNSCRELADDLRRFLDNRPIRAKPPSVVDRLAKWSRRHRTVVAIGVLLLVVAMIALSVSTALISREQARTKTALDQAEALRVRAQSDYESARDAIDEITRVVERQLAGSATFVKTRSELLSKVQAYHEEFAKTHSDNPKVMAEAAQSYQRVAEIHLKLGQYEQAQQIMLRAISLWKNLCAESTDDLNHQTSLGDAYVVLSGALLETGHSEQVESAYRKAIDVYRNLLDRSPDMPNTHIQWRLANAYTGLGTVLRRLGKRTEGIELYRQGVTLEQKVVQELPEKIEYQTASAIDLAELAWMMWDAGGSESAEAMAREAVQTFEQIAKDFPDKIHSQWEHVRAQARLAEILQRSGRRTEANAWIRKAQLFQQKLLADGPEDAAYRWLLAWNQLEICNVLRQMGRTEEAIEACRIASELKRKAVANAPHEPEYQGSLAFDLEALGEMLVSRQQYDEAQKAFVEAKAICERLMVDFPKRTSDRIVYVRICVGLSGILRELGQLEEAEQVFEEGRQLQEQLVIRSSSQLDQGWHFPWGSRRSALRQNYRLMGEMSAKSGHYKLAAAAFSGAASLDPNDVWFWRVRALTELASGDSNAYSRTCHNMLQHFVGMQSHYTASSLVWTCTLGPDVVEDWRIPLRMTEMLVGVSEGEDKGDIGTRLSWLSQKILTIYEENESLAAWYTSVAGPVLYRAGRYEDAQQVLSQLAATYVPNSVQEGLYDYSPAHSWCFLAMTCQHLGLDDSAQQWCRRTRKVLEEIDKTDTWVKRLTLKMLLAEAESELISRQSSDFKR